MRTVAAGIVFCAFAAAQITNLSSDAGGSQIFFSTTLRFRGSDQLFTPKLFRLGPAGLELVEQRTPVFIGARSNDYILAGRDLSADGTTYVTNRRAACNGGSACVFFETRYSEFVTPKGQYNFSGQGQVSANGRWGITCCGTGFTNVQTAPVRSVLRVDLESGQRAIVGLPPAIDGHWVASDGAIFVLRAGNTYALAGLDRDVPVPVSEALAWAVLSDDGQTLAWQTQSKGEIWTWTKGAPAPRQIGLGSRPSLSYDGSRLAWLGTGNQVWSCWTAACDPRQATSEDAGVREGILVGAGFEVLLLTGDNRLVVVDINNGFRAEYLGPAPQIGQPAAVAVPGSAGWVHGVFPQGADIRTQQRSFLVLQAAKDEIAYQVPWDMPVDPPDVRSPILIWAGDPVWEAQAGLGVAAFSPAPVPDADYSYGAIHEDWRGSITDSDPAKPGEILHTFMTGFGTVTPPVATGVPAQAQPLSRTTLPLSWFSVTAAGNVPAEVLYSGAAPGLIGLYQIDFRIPRDWTERAFSLIVQQQGDEGSDYLLSVAVQ